MLFLMTFSELISLPAYTLHLLIVKREQNIYKIVFGRSSFGDFHIGSKIASGLEME